MSYTIEKLSSSYVLAEGPHWDVKSQKLYYVDILKQKILRLDPETGKITSAYIKNGPVGVVIPVEGTQDKFIIGCRTDVLLVTWDGESDVIDPPTKVLTSFPSDLTNIRINDGKCDAFGRFWAGTMSMEVDDYIEPDCGIFYSVSNDLIVKNELTPIGVSNGLAWNSQSDRMFYIDSLALKIWSFDYDLKNGLISNKQVLFDLKERSIDGFPDGMTIDTNDHLWLAVYNSHCILQVDSKNGELLQKIELPVKRVTSVAFGGPNLDILYVTSAKLDDSNSGCLLSIKGLGVKGFPANNFICSKLTT